MFLGRLRRLATTNLLLVAHILPFRPVASSIQNLSAANNLAPEI